MTPLSVLVSSAVKRQKQKSPRVREIFLGRALKPTNDGLACPVFPLFPSARALLAGQGRTGAVAFGLGQRAWEMKKG